MLKPTNERLATVEQAMKDLTDKVDAIAVNIEKIKEIIQQKIVEHGDMKHDWLSNRVKKVETQVTFSKWFLPVLGAVLGSVMTFLLIEFLKNK